MSKHRRGLLGKVCERVATLYHCYFVNISLEALHLPFHDLATQLF